MQFALLILFMIQSAEQTQDAEFFFSPPCFFKTDVNGPGRAALPASLPWMRTRDRLAASDLLSKENPGVGSRARGFYFEVSSLVGDPGSLRALCRTTCIHSNRSHSGISSGGSSAAPERFAH